MLILVRHGESVANAQGLLLGRTDAELTETGRAQAAAVPTLLERPVAERSAVDDTLSINVGGNTLNVLVFQSNFAVPVTIGPGDHCDAPTRDPAPHKYTLLIR